MFVMMLEKRSPREWHEQWRMRERERERERENGNGRERERESV